LLDIAINGGDFADSHALEIHYCAASFEELAGLARTGWKARVGELLILDGEVLEHSFGGRDFVHSGEIDVAQLFDVDWSAILFVR
jgi:hypothetical protein